MVVECCHNDCLKSDPIGTFVDIKVLPFKLLTYETAKHLSTYLKTFHLYSCDVVDRIFFYFIQLSLTDFWVYQVISVWYLGNNMVYTALKAYLKLFPYRYPGGY